MRVTAVVTVLMIAGMAITHGVRAADYPTTHALAPISVFTAKDIPEAEPGKPAWPTGDKTTNYSIVYYDKWVYVASRAEYILQFQRDPATATLAYQATTPFLGYHSDENGGGDPRCAIRRLNDGNAMLTIHHGNHKTGFMWYAIDQRTGKLTAAGKHVPAKFDHHNAPMLWMPDQQRFCIGGYFWTQIYWYRFGDDGVPVADGGFALKNWPIANYSGSVRFSPDWRHMYYLLFQQSEDPICDRPPQIDTYEIDPKTHAGTCVSSVELPCEGKMNFHVGGAIQPLSPDGKHLYAFFTGGPSYSNSYYYVLARDATSGKLSIVHQKNEPTLSGMNASPYDRLDRFAFAGDGKSGYCIPDYTGGQLGHFARDPDTGALTFLPPVADMGADKLVVDPVNGNLFTVGEKIVSFKIPAATRPSEEK